MAIALAHRDRLAPEVVDELDQLVAGTRGYLGQEHDESGSHADVLADSVTIRPGGSVSFGLPSNSDAVGTSGLRVDPVDPNVLTLTPPNALHIEPSLSTTETRIEHGLIPVYSSISPVNRPGVAFGDGTGSRERWSLFSDVDGFDAFLGISNSLAEDAALAIYHIAGSDRFIVAPPFTTTHEHWLGDESDSRLSWDKIVGKTIRATTALITPTVQSPSLGIQDTGGDHYLNLKVGEDLSADRDFTILVNDADRQLAVFANVALNQDLRTTDAVTFASVDTGHGANELYPMNQAVRTTDSPTFANVQITAGGRVQATRIEIFDTDNSHTVNLVCGEDLSADRNLTITLGNASRALAITGNVGLNQDLRTTDAPTFAGLILNGAIRELGVGTTSLSSGNNNDINPSNWTTASVVEVTPDAGGLSVLTGIAARSNGTIIRVVNVGSANFTFEPESASSTAANRFGPGPTTIEPNSGTTFMYSTTVSRWIPV